MNLNVKLGPEVTRPLVFGGILGIAEAIVLGSAGSALHVSYGLLVLANTTASVAFSIMMRRLSSGLWLFLAATGGHMAGSVLFVIFAFTLALHAG